MLGKGNQNVFSGVGDTDCPENFLRTDFPENRVSSWLCLHGCLVCAKIQSKAGRLGLIGPGLWSQRTTFSFCSWSISQFLLLQSWDPQRFPWLPLQELVAYVLSTHVPVLLFSEQPSCPVHCSVSSWCQGWAQFFSSVFLSSRITHCSYLAKMSRRLKIDMLPVISFKRVFLAKNKT